MRIGYLSCAAGISGDMFLGALVDNGVPLAVIEDGLARLNLPHWKLEAEKTKKNSLLVTKVNVILEDEHHHRHYTDIVQIIEQSNLPSKVKELSLKVFKCLGEAEAKVHGTSLEEVHFHEVGALDSIIDIVGAAIGLDYLQLEKLYASSVCVGYGNVYCAHGILPVPAPATAELLKGIPIYPGTVEKEMTTPTGAAILVALADGFGDCPPLITESIGYGAGERDLPIPNVLRLLVGKTQKDDLDGDEVVVLETNIDDMNPQIYQHIFELCEDAGALDVSLSPLLMKKQRPGNLLRVIVKPEDQDKIEEIIFKETSTIGIRIMPVKRHILERRQGKVRTGYGEVSVKLSYQKGILVNVQPEYEDCLKLAKSLGVPLKMVMDEAKMGKKG